MSNDVECWRCGVEYCEKFKHTCNPEDIAEHAACVAVTEALEHRWVPIAECPELGRGVWYAKADDYIGPMLRDKYGWHEMWDWPYWESAGEQPTHILNPELGPIPEVES